MRTVRLQIDEHGLDVEWMEQPIQFHYFAKKHADAVRELDFSKAELDLTRAELDRTIREDPESFGLSKLTENVVSNVIIAEKEYQKVLKKVHTAKHLVNLLSATVDALEQRKRALEKLVDLWARDYFSEPKSSQIDPEKTEAIKTRKVYRRGIEKRKGTTRKETEDHTL